MTNVSKNVSLPDQLPDLIVVKRAELGGFVLELVYGETRTAGAFGSPAALANMLSVVLLGKQATDLVIKAKTVLKAAKEVGPEKEPAVIVPPKAPKAKKAPKLQLNPVVEVGTGAPKKRGRPALSAEEKARRAAERQKAKADGQEVKLAA
jgi:hypothetical protein